VTNLIIVVMSRHLRSSEPRHSRKGALEVLG